MTSGDDIAGENTEVEARSMSVPASADGSSNVQLVTVCKRLSLKIIIDICYAR